MSHPTLFFHPCPRVDIAPVPAVSHAGAVLLTDAIHATGLASSLREVLDPWTKPLAEHHAAKILLDLPMTLAVGGEVTRDTDLLRCEPGLFGDVASTPTISRMITTLAEKGLRARFVRRASHPSKGERPTKVSPPLAHASHRQ
ncbi:hypothetical protein BCONGLO52_26500 [Brachybacterium conglomeratum]|uniref:Transposase DDE domain-containing protein n=1 Tax=Brachybacterium conglomeratum TaxID=47846 RepID=A0ABQ5RL55_9MICO|nr:MULTISPECIES: transposase [Brachybacterium]MCT1436710.1 transposase [Brachybacterium paraconglomeratum]GLI31809.1 hypothetical protein BCONGLO52_26500 [Brachybacterium conglomeratum]GLK03342.1 hypothetical protein GCM10017597_01410 [Brachybacterium conglomeratum]